MKMIKTGPIWILILTLLITSCNLPSEEGGKATQTALFETVVAGITQTMAAKPTNTNTPQPSPTLNIPPTANPITIPTIPPSIPTVAVTPCNRATFVADVTVPDGTAINPGSTFKKTWRLQNSGTCTWTSGYSVVYVAGERMGAAESESITTSSVAPGGTVDVTVDLTAPTTAGSHTAYFRLRSADGLQFGVLTNASGTFYTQIVVSGATATAGVTPTITGMSPSSVLKGSGDFIMTLAGTNYVSGSVIKWGTTSLTTNYYSATKLTATVPYQYLTSAGTVYITVVNPGGAVSAQATFRIDSANTAAPTATYTTAPPTAAPPTATNTTVPAPIISGVPISSITDYTVENKIDITGQYFASNPSVLLNDSVALAINSSGPSSINVTIPPNTFVSGTTVTFKVSNPGGGTSNSYPVQVP